MYVHAEVSRNSAREQMVGAEVTVAIGHLDNDPFCRMRHSDALLSTDNDLGPVRRIQLFKWWAYQLPVVNET